MSSRIGKGAMLRRFATPNGQSNKAIVQEQSVTSQEITGNMQNASTAVSSITEVLQDISMSVQSITSCAERDMELS